MFGLLIGHLVGDYLLQNDWMAKGKSKPGFEGYNICLLHCVIYSFVVAMAVILDGWRPALGWFRPSGEHIFCYYLLAFAIALITHYPIDRWSLGKRWMNFYGQTTEGPFAPFVYVAVDNSVHLLLMYVTLRLLA